MTLPRGLRPSTLAVHAGTRKCSAVRTPDVPVYRTAAFTFEDVREMEETFQGGRERHIYSRYANPTIEAVEERIAALEGADGAVVFASGMAALMAAFLSVASAGDHIVALRELYGGTTRLLEGVLARMGIAITFADSSEIGELERHLRPRTRAVHIETPTNPTLRVVDIEPLARKARAAGAALFVDNTFATPINQLPLRLGATLSIHSATKYLSGHGDLVAGAVAGSGPQLDAIRELRKETGAVLDPEAGWVLGRSLKTLALRVEAQCRNAASIAGFLEGRRGVRAVHYPGLAAHPGHAVASRQMRAFGGMLSFELEGGAGAVGRFVDGLELIRLLPTLGGVESSVLVPAISSHSMVPAVVRERSGVTEGLVRLSAGIEDPEDLLADLQRALGRAAG